MNENNHKYKEGDSLYLANIDMSWFYNDNRTELKPIPVKVIKTKVSWDGLGEVRLGEIPYCVSALTSNGNEKLWVAESELYPSLEAAQEAMKHLTVDKILERVSNVKNAYSDYQHALSSLYYLVQTVFGKPIEEIDDNIEVYSLAEGLKLHCENNLFTEDKIRDVFANMINKKIV